MIAAGAFALIAYLAGNSIFSDYLGINHLAGTGELTIVCAAVIGAGLGFLWFNAPPAQIFMGDTGSLALGGLLGAVAVAIKHEIVLVIIGGLFVLESASVIVQVASFKLTGKRVFRMAPIHHHFEQMGWTEPQIVIRFWIIAFVLALIGLVDAEAEVSMTPVTTFADRSVALFGLGGSGLATARALIAGGARVAAWDDGEAGRAKALQQGIELVDLSSADWSSFDALVLSPGVPLTHPEPHWTVERAREAGIEIIGDIELFCREREAHAPGATFIAITGTNGKSTTTALIAHILRRAGKDVQLGGNIGTPILDLEPPSEERIHVIECSSFQIDLTPSLEPTIGILHQSDARSHRPSRHDGAIRRGQGASRRGRRHRARRRRRCLHACDRRAAHSGALRGPARHSRLGRARARLGLLDRDRQGDLSRIGPWPGGGGDARRSDDGAGAARRA